MNVTSRLVVWAIGAVLLHAPVASAAQPSFADTVARLGSADARERLRAVQALHEARFPEAIEPLAPMVLDPDARVQLAAIAAEAGFFIVAEEVGRTPIVDAFAGVPFSVEARPAPSELIAALGQALSDDDRQVRLDAAYLLGAVARPPLTAPDGTAVMALLQHPDPPTRAAAARLAGRPQIREAADALVAAMNDPVDDVRMAAAWAVGELRSPRGVQALTDFSVHYGRSPLGLASLAALARIAHGASLPLFRQGLSDRSADVRRLAAEGLGRHGGAESRALLERPAAADRDPVVRAAALFALQRLGHESVERLAALLADGRAFGAARQYLLESGAAPAAIAAQIANADAEVRRGVADVLGFIGTDAEIPALRRLNAGDADARVRAAAARALRRLASRGAVSGLAAHRPRAHA